MTNKLTHFAIHIDDMERAKHFYDKVFDWGFNTYGQEDFVQIKSNKSDDGILLGAMQSRKYSSIPEKIAGFECSFGVENIEEVIKKVEENGGKIVMPKTAVPHVGWIAKFIDTEGNLFCGMQYDASAR